MDSAFVMELGRRIEKETSSVIVGCGETIRLVLATLFAGGHVLMEDVPGTGKTLLCRTIAACVDMPFARIQFTPDLLPSDITGMSVYRQDTGDFRFLPGPVFTWDMDGMFGLSTTGTRAWYGSNMDVTAGQVFCRASTVEFDDDDHDDEDEPVDEDEDEDSAEGSGFDDLIATGDHCPDDGSGEFEPTPELVPGPDPF